LFRNNFSDYHIEWKPKPFPCTKAEREAAAKRYNLLPSDYKPFEDDGLAPGDYFKVEPYNDIQCKLCIILSAKPMNFRPWVLFKIFSPLFGLTFLLYIGQMFGYFSPMVSIK
ncbi:unnamed protein product, partial [Trichobilharzia regenti]